MSIHIKKRCKHNHIFPFKKDANMQWSIRKEILWFISRMLFCALMSMKAQRFLWDVLSHTLYHAKLNFSHLQPATWQYLALLTDWWSLGATEQHTLLNSLSLGVIVTAEEPQPSSALYLSRDTTPQTWTVHLNVILFKDTRCPYFYLWEKNLDTMSIVLTLPVTPVSAWMCLSQRIFRNTSCCCCLS